MSSTRPRARGHVQAHPSDISNALTEIIESDHNLNDGPRELQLLGLFKGSSIGAIANSLINFVKKESSAGDAVVLKIIPGENVKLFSLHQTLDNKTFVAKFLTGLLEVLSTKAPAFLETSLDPWGEVFPRTPQSIILLPIPKSKPHSGVFGTTDSVVCLGFFAKLPPTVMDVTVIQTVVSACRLVIPLLANTQRHNESKLKFQRVDKAIQTVMNCEKEFQEIGSCVNTICLEIQAFFGAQSCVVLLMYGDEEYDNEKQLLKYSSSGGCMINQGCPNKQSHINEQMPADASFPAGYSAINKKIVLINNKDDLMGYCGAGGPIHSIGGCIVNNVLCFTIEDVSNDMPLLIEVSSKKGGFTDKDYHDAKLLSKMLSPVLSTGVMLDYRKRIVRRCDITNELLNNIKTVQFKNVKHLLDLQFRYTGMFRRSFFTVRFVFKQLSEGQYSGIVLYMFTDLGFITRWTIRRATLIRFILSIEQGYRDNPYHNWKHACTVTHFAFILMKKYGILKDGYLRDIEAFSLFAACLCHDIDHRGVNSHFSLCMASSDPYHVYIQEDGLMERHHVAVTLQVLSADDCNIVENLSDHEYKEFIELLSSNIMATDVTKYLYDQHEHFSKISRFDKTNSEHRKVLMTVLMTACDLSESIKPWNDYLLTVKSIFSEFFIQGDEELKLGFFPTPIMDRRIAYIPYIEMKFLNEIVRPVFEVLAELIPKTAECLRTIDYYKELWLVATQVFDDNAHCEDPLDILDLKQLQEENLKIITNPLLGKEATKIRKSLVVPGKFGPLLGQSKSGIHLDHDGKEDESEDINIPEGVQVHIPLKDKILNCLGCCVCCCCKRQSLRDAALVRQTNRETEFMEARCNSYERKRSEELDMDEGPHGPLRERSHSMHYSAACRESMLRNSLHHMESKASKVRIRTPQDTKLVHPDIKITRN